MAANSGGDFQQPTCQEPQLPVLLETHSNSETQTIGTSWDSPQQPSAQRPTQPITPIASSISNVDSEEERLHLDNLIRLYKSDESESKDVLAVRIFFSKRPPFDKYCGQLATTLQDILVRTTYALEDCKELLKIYVKTNKKTRIDNSALRDVYEKFLKNVKASLGQRRKVEDLHILLRGWRTELNNGLAHVKNLIENLGREF